MQNLVYTRLHEAAIAYPFVLRVKSSTGTWSISEIKQGISSLSCLERWLSEWLQNIRFLGNFPFKDSTLFVCNSFRGFKYALHHNFSM